MAEEQNRGSRFLGSLKDALVAASRDDSPGPLNPEKTARTRLNEPVRGDRPAAPVSTARESSAMNEKSPPPSLSASEAAREARAGTPLVPTPDRHVEFEPPTTRVVRGAVRDIAAALAPTEGEQAARTQLVRGRQKVERSTFHQDPVVAWLVIVGGPGLGSYRPIFEGNNTIGRASNQRVPIDFGDDAISSEEQAYIRYDSMDRTFLFVPNLAKTNVVAVNDKKPTAAVPLAAMDVIGVGRTQLVFVPFCGPDFDWSELSEGPVTKKEQRSRP